MKIPFKKFHLPAAACLLAYSAMVASAWKFQDHIIYQGLAIGPPKGGLGPWTINRPGLVLHGWVENAGQSKAVVLFGGNAMAVEPFRSFFSTCTSRTVYLIPYRGFEGQAGHPSQAALVSDGVAVVEELLKRHPEGVAVLGVSLGTGVAMQVAKKTQVDKVILITPYDSLLKVGKDHMWGLPVGELLRDNYDSAAIASQITQPVFILRARNDRIVLPERTNSLLRAFNRPVEVEWAETGHNGIWDVSFQDQTCSFIRRALDNKIK